VVYDELRRLAAHHMRSEKPGHTLSPTALVSEAYLRLVDAEGVSFNDRSHFLAIASRNMRKILVDHARKRCAEKRGNGDRAVTLDEAVVAVDRPWELVALDDALKDLAKFDDVKARLVELHYFGGMTHEELAAVSGLHVNTVARHLRFSETWLNRQMRTPA